ncbi:MAG: hypothetical protein AAFW84_26640 [Cyanobacteria bacterium J06635_15]
MLSIFRKSALIIGVAATLGMPASASLSPVLTESRPVKQAAKETIVGNFGSLTVDCSKDHVYWYIDVTLNSTRGSITRVDGTVTSTSGHVIEIGGFANPPVPTFYDQVQIQISELPPGTYTATAAGTGRTLGGPFGFAGASCSTTIR